jgi:meso-butanediol dehydrogenase/(S,S)-butanediol dehydrogenase/diacetyl reductase|tara:strand:- start:22780 stop:23535 length:756 start_codon:yes stop_codon:yes gene_type:complete
MKRFQGKVAFVTGAASGIGLATMARLGREGAQVFAVDINAEQLAREAAGLAGEGVAVRSLALDVSDEAACRAAIAQCVAEFGKLDVLCNIAGMALTKNFADVSAADWDRVMTVNTRSVFVLCQAAMPHLLETAGNIVNISSAAGLQGLPYNSAYCASKGAVLLLSKSLAAEFAGRGVRVNAVCPGAVDTPLVKDIQIPEGADMALYGRMFPLTSYFAQAEEIAGSVAYLASDEARFITGSALVIDGGQTAI